VRYIFEANFFACFCYPSCLEAGIWPCMCASARPKDSIMGGWWSAHRIRKFARAGRLLRPPDPRIPVGLLYVFDMSRGEGSIAMP